MLVFFASLFYSLLLVLALSTYFWVTSIRDLENKLVEKATQIATTLSAMIGADFDAEQRVLLSQFMAQLVASSKNPSYGIQIDEVLLLKSNGEVLAHSNAMRMAKDQRSRYEIPEYEMVSKKSERDPILVRSLQYQETELAPLFLKVEPYVPSLVGQIKKVFPASVTVKYHVGAAYFRSGQNLPSGSFHLIAEPKGVISYVSLVKHYKDYYVFYSIFFAVAWLTFFSVLSRFSSRRKDNTELAPVCLPKTYYQENRDEGYPMQEVTQPLPYYNTSVPATHAYFPSPSYTNVKTIPISVTPLQEDSQEYYPSLQHTKNQPSHIVEAISLN